MRIQSKFKDYYDFSLPYRETDERAYYWVRNSVQSIHDPYSFPKITSDEEGRPSTGLPSFNTETFSERPSRRWRRRGEIRFIQTYVTLGNKSVAFYRDSQAVQKNSAEQAIALEMNRPVDKEWPVYSTEPDFKQREWKHWDWRTLRTSRPPRSPW